MRLRPRLYKICLSCAAGLAALLPACGGGSGGETGGGTGGTTMVKTVAESDGATATGTGGGTGGGGGHGTLEVSLTDAPSCGFDNVYVTVSKVRVHQSSDAGEDAGDWHEITLKQPEKIDLLELTNGKLKPLGEVALPAGHYTQMRLVLEPNRPANPTANSVVVSATATEVALDTPSAVQSGLKLHHPFDIEAGAHVSLTLDFDACKSIVVKGKGKGGYALKPVISVIPTTASGSISGYVPAGFGNTIISAQQNGVIVKSTVPDAQGKFVLSPLPQSATGYAVVVTADGSVNAAITGVPVTSGGDTVLGTQTARVALMGSGMRPITGAVNPVAAQGTVRAIQSYSNGLKIEVAFRSADLNTGTYTIPVASAAPLLGTFGPLPIALTPDYAVTGRYMLEASANGYATQTVSADLGVGDVVRSFTLVPSP